MNYLNVYVIDFDTSDFAIKSFKKNIKTRDLTKILSHLRYIQFQHFI